MGDIYKYCQRCGRVYPVEYPYCPFCNSIILPSDDSTSSIIYYERIDIAVNPFYWIMDSSVMF